MGSRYSVHALSPALVVIVFGTAVPVALGGGRWQYTEIGLVDFMGNVLLYAPLGLALWRRSLFAILLVAVSISICIEVLQIWSLTRFVSIFDVIANVCGAAGGTLIARLVRDRANLELVPVDLPSAVVAALAAGTLVGLELVPTPSSDLSNWDPEFEMILGNERTGDRPWHGTLSALAIIPESLTTTEMAALHDLAQPAVRAAVEAQGGFLMTNLPPFRGEQSLSLPSDFSKRFARLATTRNAFTIIATVAMENVEQQGLARLLTYSLDQFNRNFDLGQEGRRLVFRVRTPQTGVNANDRRTETRELLEPGRQINVVATFDEAVARIYVDGRLEGRTSLAAATCVIESLCDGAASFARAVLGCSLAVIAIFVVRPRDRLSAVATALLSGGAGALILWMIRPDHPVHLLEPLPQVAALAGAASVGIALRRSTIRREPLGPLPTGS